MRQKAREIIDTHKKLLQQFESASVDTIIRMAKTIIDCLENKGRIYLCGNGGSAADCQHVAGELVGRFRRNRKALPAVALSTDTSILTSVANDYSFDDVFRRQVEALINKDDILWAFSTSGSSPNVLSAARLAKEKGAKVLAFTGKKESELEKTADVCFCIDSPATSSAQEIHQLAYHIICELVEEKMAAK